MCNCTTESKTPAVGLARQPAGKVNSTAVPTTPSKLPAGATDFPPPPPAGAVRTYASHVGDVVVKDSANWLLRLAVPIPAQLVRPTLTALVYYVKYATTYDNGDSTLQTDVVLTSASAATGVITDSYDAGLYLQAVGYGPRIVNEENSVVISSVPVVKSNAGTAQWSHYVDRRQFAPNIHVVSPTSQLYLNFNVSEYPTPCTARVLAVEVVATWLDDTAERKRLDDEKAKAAAAAAKKAKEEEEERKRKEEEAKKEAEKKLVEKIKQTVHSELDPKIADLEKKLKDAEASQKKAEGELRQKIAQEEAERKAEDVDQRKKASDSEAQRKATEAELQKKIADEEAQRKAADEQQKKDAEAADAKRKAEKAAEAAKNAPADADATMQKKIEEALKNLPADRKCPQGYAWKKTDKGYTCGGGGHHITWDELANI